MKKKICIIVVIIALLIGGGFWLHWYYEPIPYRLELQMCNAKGDVHMVRMEGTWERALDRETTFHGTVWLDGEEYTGTARYGKTDRYVEVTGIYYPVAEGKSGTLWLDYRFYEEIELYVFTYDAGEEFDSYYAPATMLEEYQEAYKRLEVFLQQ